MPNPRDQLESLARLAVETLDAQRAYFARRSGEDLEHAKQLERRLRRAAEEALRRDDAPTLF